MKARAATRYTPESSWFIRSEFAPSLSGDLVKEMLFALTDSSARLFVDGKNVQVFKEDRTTTVVKMTFGDRAYVVKRFNARSNWHRLKRTLRQSRARRCWKAAGKFRRAGIRTARPAGWVEHRWGPLRGDSYYISEYIPGEVCLGWLPGQDESTWEAFSKQVEDLFSAMRRDGLSHGDMKASNLIWSDGALYVVDLDAAGKARLRFRRRQLGKRDRKRFMRNWPDAPALRKWLDQRLGI